MKHRSPGERLSRLSRAGDVAPAVKADALKLEKELEFLRNQPGNRTIRAQELARILGNVLDNLEAVRKEVRETRRTADSAFAQAYPQGSGR